MKRMLSLTAILLCALLAFGACTDTPELSDVPSEPTASESSEQPFELELAIEREANASLREEVRRKERVLQNAQVENTSLSNRISVLERELSAALEESERLAAQLTALQSSTKKRMRPLGNGAVLVYADNGQLYGGLLADEMKVVYEDGAEVEIGSGLSSVEVSPDGTRLLYNQDFAWESVGTLWLYDFEAREKRQFSLDGLPTGSTPAYADWLDDRYVLYIEQYASGTITVGGELCVYDTETAKSARLTDTVKERFQICSFTVYGQDCIVFRAEQYDEGYGETESSYPVLTVAKLYDVIRSGGTVDLRS